MNIQEITWVRTENDWNNRYGLGSHINIIVTLERYKEQAWKSVHAYLYNPVTKNRVCIQRGPEMIPAPKSL